MNEKVIKVLNEQIWYLATYSDEANCVPVGFKSVTEDGKLLVGDVSIPPLRIIVHSFRTPFYSLYSF